MFYRVSYMAALLILACERRISITDLQVFANAYSLIGNGFTQNEALLQLQKAPCTVPVYTFNTLHPGPNYFLVSHFFGIFSIFILLAMVMVSPFFIIMVFPSFIFTEPSIITIVPFFIFISLSIIIDLPSFMTIILPSFIITQSPIFDIFLSCENALILNINPRSTTNTFFIIIKLQMRSLIYEAHRLRKLFIKSLTNSFQNQRQFFQNL